MISSVDSGAALAVVRLPARIDPVPRVGEDKVENPLPTFASRADSATISPEAQAMLAREQAAAAKPST